MTRSARGTLAEPGRQVAQKAGLNRAILAKGWSKLLLDLEHKARYHGAQVVKVNPAFTSQRCAGCGHTGPTTAKAKRCSGAEPAVAPRTPTRTRPATSSRPDWP